MRQFISKPEIPDGEATTGAFDQHNNAASRPPASGGSRHYACRRRSVAASRLPTANYSPTGDGMHHTKTVMRMAGTEHQRDDWIFLRTRNSRHADAGSLEAQRNCTSLSHEMFIGTRCEAFFCEMRNVHAGKQASKQARDQNITGIHPGVFHLHNSIQILQQIFMCA